MKVREINNISERNKIQVNGDLVIGNLILSRNPSHSDSNQYISDISAESEYLKSADSSNDTIPSSLGCVVRETMFNQLAESGLQMNANSDINSESIELKMAMERDREMHGNMKSKTVTELSVENEILKIEIESIIEGMKTMQRLKEKEINDWKQRYRLCKLELEQLKQSKQR